MLLHAPAVIAVVAPIVNSLLEGQERGLDNGISQNQYPGLRKAPTSASLRFGRDGESEGDI